MNEVVKAWIDLPPTHRSYREGLEIFSRMAGFKYPMVVSKLNLGPFGDNVSTLEIYMHKILNQRFDTNLNISFVKAPSTPKKEEAPNNKNDDLVAVRVRKLNSDKRDLLIRRMKLSDSFHNCKTDEDRAGVCDDIRAVNNVLKQINGKLEHFNKKGNLPEEKEAGAIILPEDDAELAILQNRISSNKIQVRNSIQVLEDLPEGSPKKENLPARLERLQELNNLYNLIKAKRGKK